MLSIGLPSFTVVVVTVVAIVVVVTVYSNNIHLYMLHLIIGGSKKSGTRGEGGGEGRRL